MRPRIAIPLPHSADREYSERALPQYERAVEDAGGEPVRIPLDLPPARVMKLIQRCDGVLLPGSKADVDPSKYDAARHPKTEAADHLRDTVDELLLQDAYNMRKPVLGICYGLQILNVYRSGTLLQHIESLVDHAVGKKAAVAHTVAIEAKSMLAEIVASGATAPTSQEREIPRLKPGASTVATAPVVGTGDSMAVYTIKTSPADSREGHGFSRAGNGDKLSEASAPEGLVLPVNSSHHQSAEVVGDSLRIVARCPDDGIIEALEGTARDHFVLAVQWHPERSTKDEPSRAIFRALIEAAQIRRKELAGEFESV